MAKFTIKQKRGETFEIEVADDGSNIKCNLPSCEDSTICKHVFLASKQQCLQKYNESGITVWEDELDRIKKTWNQLPLHKRIFI